MWRAGSVRAALVMSVALLVGACGASVVPDTENAAPRHGGSVTVGLEGSWVSLDPLRATTYNSFSVLQTIYEPLFDLDRNGAAVPNLATGYEVSPDGRIYTVTLRDGVTFHDGARFDARAVVANFDRVRNPANGCSCLGELRVLEGVRATGDTTVEFRLKRPHAGFPVMVLGGAAGLMASPRALAETGGDLARRPVGTGPFVLDHEVPGSSVRVRAWDGYRDPGRPYLDSVEFRVISDSDSRYSSLTSTAIDVADNVSVTWLSDAELNPSVRIHPQGASGSNFVMFQTGEGSPFRDARARQAACMALDPPRIDEALYRGVRLTGQESPFPTGGGRWDLGRVEGYPRYDRERARRLVAEVGGISFDLNFTNSPDNVRVAQALAAQWAVVGIEARVRPMDQPTLVEKAFGHRFDAMIYRWRGAMDPDGNVSRWFHSSQATPAKPSSNYNLVDDPELDRLMMQAAAVTEPGERAERYRAVSERLAGITPYCYLWGADWYRVTLANVHGIPSRPDNIMMLRDAYVVE
ncbi:hypothetical protein H7X46_05080 [Pseudonocardia sp. C8]|uniref:ABC transporter substrate-binding protein n=1 Tax=Pseudonocardia sp. C8 TaxID=2762759 RepID=UPI001642BACE|nr:ABC transporter substrate-binding protein [Pseudonocardia sp. C8]MBC3190434.1 hypothetical protein [Pseudonocardia sp. C8]